MLKQPLRYFIVMYFILLCVLAIPRIATAQSPSPTPSPILTSVAPLPTSASPTANPALPTPSLVPLSTSPNTSPEWLPGLATSLVAAAGGAIGGAIIVSLLEERKRKRIKREEIETAIRRLYDEALSNQQWLSDLSKTRLYLRDGAWVLLKNQGYLIYLPKDVSMKVADVYKYLHAVNEVIRELREDMTSKKKVDSYERQVQEGIELLRPALQDLISKLETLPLLQRINKEAARLQ